MKLLSLTWSPTFVVEFSGADLNVLQRCSQHHYDGKCKQASAPPRDGQESKHENRFLYAMMNGHNMRQEGLDHLPDPTGPTPHVTQVSEHRLSVEELDTLCKVAEMEQYHCRSTADPTQLTDEYQGRSLALLKMLRAANDVWEAAQRIQPEASCNATQGR